MGQIIVRGIDNTVLDRLSELAEKKKMSRESYVRDLLTSAAIAGELMELDFKYANLVTACSDREKMLGDIIDKNSYLLEELLDRLDEKNEEKYNNR